MATEVYCFSATNWPVVPCSLSIETMLIVFPSELTVMRFTLITLPFRLSVSSIVFLSIRLTETFVVPGSPL